MSADQLREAYRLIKAGSNREATQLLIPIVRTDKTNADAWWLLANALTDPEKQRKALEEVLNLRPDDERARRMYARLMTPPTIPLETPSLTTTHRPVVTEPTVPLEDQPVLILDERDTSTDDPFTLVDDTIDPFEDYDYDAGKGKRVAVRRSSGGTSPLVILLAVIGVVAMISCGVCLLATGGAAALLGTVLPEVVQTVAADPQVQALMTNNPEFQTLAADPDLQRIMGTATAAAPDGGIQPDVDRLNEASIRQLGEIRYGQAVEGTVDTFTGDAYTFAGNAGDLVTIRVNERDGELDPQVFLYDAVGNLLAMHDDIDFSTDNRNALLEAIPLPEAGTYTIVVRAFSGGGDYTLSLERE